MVRHVEWWLKDNGKVRRELDFTLVVAHPEGERCYAFTVDNPPIFDGDNDTFTRLSFERLKAIVADAGLGELDSIRRGEVYPGPAVRPCYLHRKGERVPFAVCLPAMFVK